MTSSNISFETIRTVLSNIQDPAFNRDIVSLGAIKKLQIKEGCVSFEVWLGVSGPQAEEVRLKCEQSVRALEGVEKVEVTVASLSSRQSEGSLSQPSQGPVSMPNVKHVIAVASGKGGVGKSTVAVNLAVAMAQTGARVGLLDADIYGPSIPLMFGSLGAEVPIDEGKAVPVSKYNVKLMSIGFMVEADEPVIWRGPRVHAVLTEFIDRVHWGELDYLFIDMPPGTGDAQLTISKFVPLKGAIIVTTPQDISLIDANKGLRMFQKVKVPILGVVENMSGFVCSHCEQVTHIFREGGGKHIAQTMEVPLLGCLPLDPKVAESGDDGHPVVEAHPNSPVSVIYREMVDKITMSLQE